MVLFQIHVVSTAAIRATLEPRDMYHTPLRKVLEFRVYMTSYPASKGNYGEIQIQIDDKSIYFLSLDQGKSHLVGPTDCLGVSECSTALLSDAFWGD